MVKRVASDPLRKPKPVFVVSCVTAATAATFTHRGG
jgi:hypothetical protein